jgi:hypothetical protein
MFRPNRKQFYAAAGEVKGGVQRKCLPATRFFLTKGLPAGITPVRLWMLMVHDEEQ